MTKTRSVVAISILAASVAVHAQNKSDKNFVTPDGPLTPVFLSDGDVSLFVDSFGRAGHSSAGCAGIADGFRVGELDSVLCEHTDYLSTGGPVSAINSITCTVVNPITADSAFHATSTVQCGQCTIDFDQAVSGADNAWTTMVQITGCPLACYYAYNDYDVHGFMNNDGSFQLGGKGILGQFVVRNAAIMPNVEYLFVDKSGAVHWQQGEFPTVRNLIGSAATCVNLGDAPPLFNGDWTGAFQYSFDGSGTASVSYSLGRDDTVPFP